ncbi:hypothetical protein N7499_010788 [Penicillium canescens]|nr:hypothetical protein N7499_010788 [Penicillium canescens]KAJ6183042.1 hypothetical protein N7485_001684 [Penicillium canescens]
MRKARTDTKRSNQILPSSRIAAMHSLNLHTKVAAKIKQSPAPIHQRIIEPTGQPATVAPDSAPNSRRAQLLSTVL